MRRGSQLAAGAERRRRARDLLAIRGDDDSVEEVVCETLRQTHSIEGPAGEEKERFPGQTRRPQTGRNHPQDGGVHDGRQEGQSAPPEAIITPQEYYSGRRLSKRTHAQGAPEGRPQAQDRTPIRIGRVDVQGHVEDGGLEPCAEALRESGERLARPPTRHRMRGGSAERATR